MLLFCDGFDHYVTADITKKWSNAYSGLISTTGGRRGGGAMYTNSSSVGPSKSIAAVNTLICGAALFYSAGLPSTSYQPIFHFYDNSTYQVTIAVGADGSVRAYRGNSAGTVLGTSAAGVVVPDVYQYIEAKVKAHASTGTVEVRVNGVTVMALTGQNTQNSSTAQITVFQTGNSSTSKILYFDDLYLCDTSGSTNNDFLGDVRIDTLLPNADGTYSELNSPAGAHWSQVAEGAPDTTTYVYGNSAGQRDSFHLGALSPVTGSIKGIQVVNAAMKDDAGARSIANLIRSGTTDAVGPTVALSTGQTMYTSIHELDPATGAAWTESGINALEAGVKVAA